MNRADGGVDRRRADAAGRAGELAGVGQPAAVGRVLQGPRHDAGGEGHHRRERGGVVGPAVQAAQGTYVADSQNSSSPCTVVVTL